jgi:enoyl reductase
VRSVVFKEYGPPSVLALAEVPGRKPGATEVRIEMKAAGVQPFDCAIRRGEFVRFRQLTLPSGLGNEVAGVVREVGPQVDPAVLDTEVVAFCDMVGYADEVVVPSENLAPRPSTFSWEQAGALAVSGQTADTALDALEIGAGDRLLIHAAAGGVGSMAVQLAVARGARVFGTASSHNHAYLVDLGAHPVNYGPDLVDQMRRLGGATKILDCVGGVALDQSVSIASARRVITVADWAHAAELGVERIGTDRSSARLAHLVSLAEAGKLTVNVQAAYPLDQATAAHAVVEGRHVRGKVVLSASM